MFSLEGFIRERGIHGQVVVSAEVGLNHNGDPDLALKTIEMAAEAGCQAVKFQNHRTGDTVRSRKQTITVDGQDWNEWDLFSRCELDFETLRILKAKAEACGLLFHSTPTNERGMRDLLELDVPVLKLASDMAAELPMRVMARHLFHHVIASAALVSPDVVRDNPDWLWLHCVREYPAPNAYLHGLTALRQQGIYLVGYSDHTEGITAAVSAVKDYGAVWVECHVTLSHELPGPDHRWSKDPTQVKELVRCLKM